MIFETEQAVEHLASGSRRWAQSDPDQEPPLAGDSVSLILPDLRGYSLEHTAPLAAMASRAYEALVVVDEGAAPAAPAALEPIVVPPKTPWPVRMGVAAQKARGKFLLVLSDGTLPVGPASVPLLLEAVRDWHVGLAGSCLVNPWGRVTAAGWSLGGPRGLVPNLRGKRARRARIEDPKPERVHVDALPAGAWAIRKSTWNEIGPFDATLPRPWAEADLCQTIWHAGRSCVCVSNSLAIVGTPPRPVQLNPLFAARWPNSRLTVINPESSPAPQADRLGVQEAGARVAEPRR